LLRPNWWVEQIGVQESKTFNLSIPEMKMSGPTKVLSIKAMKPGPPRGAGTVTGTFKHEATDVFDLQLEGEKKPIGVTFLHPFRSADRDKWVAVGKLKIGERVVTRDGTTKVISFKHRPGKEYVYNIEVHGTHTYFVGTVGGGAWVHNSCVYWDGANWRNVDGTIGTEPIIIRKPGSDLTLDKIEVSIDGGTVRINTGHGFNRPHVGPGGVTTDLRLTGLARDDIERTIIQDFPNAIHTGAAPTVTGIPSFRQVTVGGHAIEYSMFKIGPGQYGISTYYLL